MAKKDGVRKSEKWEARRRMTPRDSGVKRTDRERPLKIKTGQKGSNGKRESLLINRRKKVTEYDNMMIALDRVQVEGDET